VEPIHILPNYFLRNNFKIFLPSTPTISKPYFSSGFQTKILHTFEKKNNKMGGVCGTYGGEERCIQIFGRKN
jgi:hypothetical protein